MSTQIPSTSATAANQLSDDKSWARVDFAITGNKDADLISGVAALLTELGLDGQNEFVAEIFSYLSTKYRMIDRNQRTMQNQSPVTMLPGPSATDLLNQTRHLKELKQLEKHPSWWHPDSFKNPLTP